MPAGKTYPLPDLRLSRLIILANEIVNSLHRRVAVSEIICRALRDRNVRRNPAARVIRTGKIPDHLFITRIRQLQKDAQRLRWHCTKPPFILSIRHSVL